MALSAMIMSSQGDYYDARPCGQIDFIFNGNRSGVLGTYPECAAYYSGAKPDLWALVHVNMHSKDAAEMAPDTMTFTLGASSGLRLTCWLGLVSLGELGEPDPRLGDRLGEQDELE